MPKYVTINCCKSNLNRICQMISKSIKSHRKNNFTGKFKVDYRYATNNEVVANVLNNYFALGGKKWHST